MIAAAALPRPASPNRRLDTGWWSRPGWGGKSTTAANLAVLAETGKDVLLVSVDLRRPRVHQFFGLSAVLDAEPMRRFLKEQRDRFDFIVLDCPPAVVVADALALARWSSPTPARATASWSAA